MSKKNIGAAVPVPAYNRLTLAQRYHGQKPHAVASWLATLAADIDPQKWKSFANEFAKLVEKFTQRN